MVVDASRTEQIQQLLEQAIFSGELAPGEKLDELELAARFNVSRTPIREALRHLSAAGLVETRSRQPAQVAQLSPKK